MHHLWRELEPHGKKGEISGTNLYFYYQVFLVWHKVVGESGWSYPIHDNKYGIASISRYTTYSI